MRITVEFVGGVTGRFPKESMVARELAVRKLGGNAVELASRLLKKGSCWLDLAD